MCGLGKIGHKKCALAYETILKLVYFFLVDQS